MLKTTNQEVMFNKDCHGFPLPWFEPWSRKRHDTVDVLDIQYDLYGCWTKNMGVSPQIIHFNRVFHYFHHPFWGTIIFGNTHIRTQCMYIIFWMDSRHEFWYTLRLFFVEKNPQMEGSLKSRDQRDDASFCWKLSPDSWNESCPRLKAFPKKWCLEII